MFMQTFHRSLQCFSRLRDDCRANFAVTFAIAAVPLMMGLGIAIDYTSASNVRSSLQQALDAAVLAGARETDDAKKAAAASTFFQTEVATKLETGQMTAQADFGVESDGTVTGNARVHLPTNFTHLMGVKHLPVTAKAAAIAAGTASKVCVLLVNPSKSQALLLNSGAVVNAPDCEFHVRSTANPAAVFNGGTTLNVKTACIKGTQIIKNGGANPPAQTGCNAVTDPLAGKLPAVSAGSCDYNNQTYNPGNVSLNPGT